ncbi:hypothetical protein MESS2_700008 [Mesorhizobium metallidurans STM 2683]|uniref:Uncharacterized protein n=1 Tax=Mesorhizobium metallidurans STM 2683 TaxID=1297569 RepID=M5EVU1_9HYPH|nr:hypothetical protein MESS2_700008 [Mesorhizobium metallidurans STM 2683]
MDARVAARASQARSGVVPQNGGMASGTLPVFSRNRTVKLNHGEAAAFAVVGHKGGKYR